MPFLIPRSQYLSLRWLNAPCSGVPVLSHGGPARAYHFYLARNALFQGLRVLGLRPGDHVLVPAYVCTVVVEALESFGARVSYYEVTRECRVDLADCESKITPGTRAIVAVHHFGFPQSLAALSNLCRRHSLRLVEDCAHVLAGEIDGRPLGGGGDIAIFSWRKFMPIHDGGTLLVNDPALSAEFEWADEPWMARLLGVKNTLDIVVESGRSSVLPALFKFASFLRRWGRRYRASGVGNPVGNSPGISGSRFDVSLVDRPMSGLSRWILGRLDVHGIVAKRRDNYRRLAQGLSSIEPFELLYPELPDDACPWLMPLRQRGVHNAHRQFRERGIPASHWGDVRPPNVDPRDCPIADELYDGLFFLPVHQDLTEQDLDAILAVARSIAVEHVFEPTSRSNCAGNKCLSAVGHAESSND